MKVRTLLSAFLFFVAAEAMAQSSFVPYAARTEFLLASPGSQGLGLLGYDNPALLNYVERGEALLAWATAPASRTSVDQWGWFAGLPHLGFGLLHQEVDGRGLYEYRLSCSGGDRGLGVGIGYGWARGHTRELGRGRHLVFGTLLRPVPWLSSGFTLTAPFSHAELLGPGREVAFDLAFRPLGSERLTLFAEAAAASRRAGDQTFWSAGVTAELLPGVRLTGRFFDNRTASLGLHLGLGRLGFETQSRFDRDRRYAFSTYLLRLGSREANVLERLRPGSQYLDLELRGPLRHRRFAFLERGHTLAGLMTLIQQAQRDPEIAGLAINFSGLKLDPAMSWELRSLLQQFRAAGKRVVAYLDRADLETYYLVSVADFIVLDPVGMIALQGFVSGRTYFKGTLDKLGIGFEEWRLFEYKSALESLAREGMSEASREQEQALLDDFYALVREEICASRKLTPEQFDRLVDEETLFLSQAALERGLVDRLGRWDQFDEILQETAGQKIRRIESKAYLRFGDSTWGPRPRLAVIYALGLCDLEEGIGARRLVEEFAEVRDDDQIRAVVLRVDSPGGDALASDLVAGAVQRCRQKKPVIVSQGYVAASGGYWISMNADAIVAAPNTITGSIGVIGGWLYDRGFKEELGLSTDHVQVGAHADLGFGLNLFGLHLPDRNLRPEERERVDAAMRTLYDEFVAKAAAGRRRTTAAIDSVGRGRVWSGRRALEHGLIDSLGGLDTAVRLAQEKAGMRRDQPVLLDERPRRFPFNLELSFSPFLGGQRFRNPLIEYFRFRLAHNGQPLLLLPAEELNSLYLEP